MNTYIGLANNYGECVDLIFEGEVRGIGVVYFIDDGTEEIEAVNLAVFDAAKAPKDKLVYRGVWHRELSCCIHLAIAACIGNKASR